MKRLNAIFIIAFSFIALFSDVVAHDPCFKDDHEFLLTVVIMVKNEADNIIPTLKPFVDAGVASFLVYDTGSTDGTQDLIREYFKDCAIEHAYIVEEPFVDFATSRNRALDLAEQIFVHNTFLVMLDAEWYTYNVNELMRFCELHKNYISPNCTGSCYLMRLFSLADSINNYTPRLIRQGYNVRYVGVVHESIPNRASGIVPDSVYFEYRPQQCGQDKTKARLVRDYALLKKHLDDNPTDMRTMFYLAQTCQFMNEWEEAIFYYQKRLDRGALCEEKYLAAYRIGCAIEHILAEGSITQYRWEDAFNYYLIAHTMLPCRAEPLFRIACHYIRQNQHAVAYLFAIRAAELPYPSNHSLFVENKIYNYLRYDILGQSALYAEEYAIGKAAVLKAMEVDPESEHLLHNLSVYDRILLGN